MPSPVPVDTWASVPYRPPCDPCSRVHVETIADYSAKVPVTQRWERLCFRHFVEFGCSLGIGRGQQLIVRKF